MVEDMKSTRYLGSNKPASDEDHTEQYLSSPLSCLVSGETSLNKMLPYVKIRTRKNRADNFKTGYFTNGNMRQAIMNGTAQQTLHV